MFTVQRTAIDKALKILDAAGCDYWAKAPDGQTFGVLPAMAPPVAPPRKRRPPINFRQTGYTEALRPLQVGQVAVLKPPLGATARQMYKTVYTFCYTAWGVGNFQIAITKGCVEVLRTG